MQDSEEDTEKALPATVTLLVTEPQSRVLAALEAEGKLHLSLVFRGEQAEAQKFLDLQTDTLAELYPPEVEGEAVGEETPAGTVETTSGGTSPEEAEAPEAGGQTGELAQEE